MKGDFCSRCGKEKVMSATGKLGPICLANAYKLNQQKTTIKLIIKIHAKEDSDE